MKIRYFSYRKAILYCHGADANNCSENDPLSAGLRSLRFGILHC